MAKITFKGNPVNTSGNLPQPGSKAPDFSLVATDLSECSLATFSGKTIILNVFPSADTGVCAKSIRRFNEMAGQLDETVVVNVSMDLPFAHKRFCDSEGLTHVKSVSAFRSPAFGTSYGVTMADGPLRGLLCRAVFVIDPQRQIVHTQLVPEIAQEPDYDAVLSAAGQMA